MTPSSSSDRGFATPVTHVNRKRETHCIHAGKTSKGKLSDLVERFCPHIGHESFNELV